MSEATIAEILRERPATSAALRALVSLRGDLPQAFYGALLKTCLAEYRPEGKRLSKELPRVPAVDHVDVRRSERSNTPLTPDQQLREARLITWRKREAERLNLPHFLVLSASVIRHRLAQTSPTSPAELGAIPGIGPEKLARYAADLLVCCHPNPPAASPADAIS